MPNVHIFITALPGSPGIPV